MLNNSLVRCVDIVTIFPDSSTHGRATGKVIVKEIRPGITIDYEEFELLFITVRVYDDNTELGSEYDECKLIRPSLVTNFYH